MSRIMLLPVVITMSVFSILAGMIWWVYFIIDYKHWAISVREKKMIPTFCTDKREGRIWLNAEFLNIRYPLFSLKKITRDKAGQETTK